MSAKFDAALARVREEQAEQARRERAAEERARTIHSDFSDFDLDNGLKCEVTREGRVVHIDYNGHRDIKITCNLDETYAIGCIGFNPASILPPDGRLSGTGHLNEEEMYDAVVRYHRQLPKR